jgi:histidine decarboxylase
MKQGVDDVGRIRKILNSMAIPRSYLHCDAALGGMVLPFLDDAPIWDFRAGIDSVSISGHKLIGSPVPCGIVLARKDHVSRISRLIEYVGTLDTTITGSRNGITPLFLWYAIRKYGRQGFAEKVARCLENAEYVVHRFNALGIAAWRNPLAMTVVFPKPPKSVLEKWQIAVQGKDAHIITMPHVRREQLDQFIADVEAAYAVKVVS